MIDDRNDPCCRHLDRTIPESGDATMTVQRRPDLRRRRWNDYDDTPGTTKRLRLQLLMLMLVLLGREDLLRSFYYYGGNMLRCRVVVVDLSMSREYHSISRDSSTSLRRSAGGGGELHASLHHGCHVR